MEGQNRVIPRHNGHGQYLYDTKPYCYRIRDERVFNGCLHAGEQDDSVAAQAKRLETSEQKRSKMYNWSQIEGLATLWRVTDVSQH